MGRNSKARRDARKRQAAPGHSAGPGSGTGTGTGSPFGRPEGLGRPRDQGDDLARAAELIGLEIRRLAAAPLTRPQAVAQAEGLLRRSQPVPASVVADTAVGMLRQVVGSVARSGWCPSDLAEATTRSLGAHTRPHLAALLAADARTDPVAVGLWVEQVEALGRPRSPEMSSPAGLADVLLLAALLSSLIPLPETVSRSGATRRGQAALPPDLAKQLARVRALLAKAESTAFDEEAEALSAKAQELISRYALDRMLAEETGSSSGSHGSVTALRIWLDAPYIDAKATLVHHVAIANRCRSVFYDAHGVCTVIGDAEDLASVELLVTSLLVQASRAMMRHGSQTDRYGRSSTRSFRQSFLLSYAVRIGQRLTEAAEQAVTDHVDTGRLVPVLRSREEHVEAAFHELFPRTFSKATSISNEQGWHAGQVAADLAQLDVRATLPDRPASDTA